MRLVAQFCERVTKKKIKVKDLKSGSLLPEIWETEGRENRSPFSFTPAGGAVNVKNSVTFTTVPEIHPVKQ